MAHPTQASNVPSLVSLILHTQTLGPLFLSKSLTKGTQGVLYLAQSSSRLYAVKHVLNSHLSPAARLLQQNEAEIQYSVSSLKHVQSVLEACVANGEGNGWFLVTDYEPGGNLFDYLRHSSSSSSVLPHLSEWESKRLFLQIVTCVAQLHQLGVYHRDIKPENILVSKDGQGKVELRLTDFGLATRQEWSRERGYGSLLYMPPEAMPYYNDSGIGYSSQDVFQLPLLNSAKHDVWSLGQLAVNFFLKLSAWTFPGRNDPCFAFYLSSPSVHLMRYLKISEEFNHILVRAFALDPKQRCDAVELLSLVESCPKFVISDGEFEQRRKCWDHYLHRWQTLSASTMGSMATTGETPSLVERSIIYTPISNASVLTNSPPLQNYHQQLQSSTTFIVIDASIDASTAFTPTMATSFKPITVVSAATANDDGGNSEPKTSMESSGTQDEVSSIMSTASITRLRKNVWQKVKTCKIWKNGKRTPPPPPPPSIRTTHP